MSRANSADSQADADDAGPVWSSPFGGSAASAAPPAFAGAGGGRTTAPPGPGSPSADTVRTITVDNPLGGTAQEVTLPVAGFSAVAVRAAVAKLLGHPDFELVAHGPRGARLALSAEPEAALAALAAPGARASVLPSLAAGRLGKQPAGLAAGQMKRLDMTDPATTRAVLAALPPSAQIVVQLVREGEGGGPPVTEAVPITPAQLIGMLDAAAPGGPLSGLLQPQYAAAAARGGGPRPAPAAPNPAAAAAAALAGLPAGLFPPGLADALGMPGPPVDAAAPAGPAGRAPHSAAAQAKLAQERFDGAQAERKRVSGKQADNRKTSRALEALRDKKAAQQAKRDRRRRAKLGLLDPTAAAAEPAAAPPNKRKATGAFGFKKGFLM